MFLNTMPEKWDRVDFKIWLGDWKLRFSYGFPLALPGSGCVRGLVPHHNCIMVCLYTSVNAYNHKQSCHAGFSQGSYFGESHPLWEKCSNISPYSPKFFSRVEGKHSEQLAAGFSCASPQNCIAQSTSPDFPQGLRHVAYPFPCCLSQHRDMCADTDWGITVTPGFQFAVKLQPQESDLKRMCQTPLQGFY